MPIFFSGLAIVLQRWSSLPSLTTGLSYPDDGLLD